MPYKIRRNSITNVLAMIALLPAVAVAAEVSDNTRDFGLEEIVVTATKSDATLSRVASAVTAISGADMGPGGVQDIGDLLVQVPNISIGDQFGVNRTFIRGVGLNNFDIGGEGAVAFLQNAAILARPAQQLSGFYDLAQIEVLRGPQSILYGRGATAGAINLVTAKPTEELSGYVQGTYGNYDSKIIEAAVGGGLVEDKLMVRVAGKYEKRDGYGTNLFTGNPVDNRDSYAMRATVVGRLSDNLELTILADYFREDDNNYAFHYFGPSVVPDSQLPHKLIGGQSIFDYYASIGEEPDVRNIYSDEEAINDREGYSFMGTLDWSKDDIEIKSITAYRSFERFQRDDLDVSDVNMLGQNNYTEDSESISQEITVNYKTDKFELLGGAMYFHERLGGRVLVPLVNLGVLFGLPADTFDDGAYDQNGVVKIDAVGAYLQGAYNVSPDFRVTLGARYNYEHRKGVGYFKFDAIGQDIPTDVSKGWSSITPKVLVEYTPSDDTLIYASVTKGFKSGVINVGSADPAVNPETVWSYEGGFKQKLLDNRLLLTGAVFYYDYSDLQVSFVNAQSVVQTINAATARNYGAELELNARVTDKLAVNANVSYLNAKFTSFCNSYYGSGFAPREGISYPACPDDPALVDLSGNRLPNAPRVSFGAGFNWDLMANDSGTLTLDADVKYQGKVYFSEFNNRDADQGDFAIINAGLTYYDPSGQWSVKGWVKNLTNEDIISNNIITAALFSNVRVGSMMPPRTYGATLGYKF